MNTDVLDLILISGCTLTLLWLPGEVIAAIHALLSGSKMSFTTKITAGMASIPVFWLWLSWVDVQVDRSLLLVIMVILVGIVLLFRGLAHLEDLVSGHLWRRPRISCSWVRIVLSGVFVIVLALRFIQIRDLVLPAWVDSPHHTLTVDLLREQGRIPVSWAPYVPAPFYYHFGFHTVVAVAAEVVGLSSAHAVLLIGQIVSALAALATYRMALKLTGQIYIGLVTALLTGVFSQMPAYYTSWGRYALLEALVILPIVIGLAWDTASRPKPQSVLIMSWMVAGLILSHYRAAALYACFLCILGLITFWHKGFGREIIALIAFNLLGVLLIAPWIIRITPYIQDFTWTPEAGLGSFEVLQSVADFHTLDPHYRNAYMYSIMTRPTLLLTIALALFGFIFAERPERSVVFLLSGWIVLLATLISPWGKHRQPFINSDLFVVTLYLPLMPLAVLGIRICSRKVSKLVKSPSLFPVLSLGVPLMMVGWGIADTLTIVTPFMDLTTEADVEALTWIKTNTPPESRFLINVAHLEGTVYRGTDGGWWIPLLSDRTTILPPTITYGFASQEFVLQVGHTAESILTLEGCDEAFWELVAQENLTHIYIGANGGPLRPGWFDQCPGVRRVYMGYQVHIYEIVPE